LFLNSVCLVNNKEIETGRQEISTSIELTLRTNRVFIHYSHLQNLFCVFAFVTINNVYLKPTLSNLTTAIMNVSG